MTTLFSARFNSVGAKTSAMVEEQTEQPKCPIDHTNIDKDHPLWAKYHAHHQEMKQKLENMRQEKQLPEQQHLKSDAFAGGLAGGGCSSSSIADASDQQLNVLNNMPPPNQNIAPGQKMPLSKDREKSTIPMSGAHDGNYWVYPSEQMFFNAMRRKNWSPNEVDMQVVVPIHNAVNERCWKHILEWESLHSTQCGQPKLLKFQGRPTDVTPKARFRQLLGYTLPFDRHDWIVDRCGKQVRYVIDFYTGAAKHPEELSFYLDVRPAITFQGILDRIHKYWKTGSGLW